MTSIDTMEASEATIEIKIKTLDSQTYTLRVDKQMPVPALKEQIAGVTGVLSEQQRLICRGKVLKDDQLLSAYHVEDGHTLHMVVRQPISPSSEGLFNDPAHDPASTSRHTHQIAPGVVIETFSLPSQGYGSPPPEISQILSAVLGSMGISGFGGGSEGVENRDNSTQRPERTSGTLGSVDFQLEQIGSRASSNTPHVTSSAHSAGFSLGSLQPSVIPDSLTTMTHYLSNISREFQAIGRGRTSGEDRSSQTEATGMRQGFPTASALAEVIVSARHLLTDNAAEALLQVERQLENQASVTDSSARSSTQAGAMRTGALIHNLGSFLLELGRTIMTLRMGQTPSEAVVNAGPAVFISPNGPNPIMVQALPFQVGSSIGSVPMGAVQSGSGLVNGIGAGYIPRRRRIDIQIRRGSPTPTATITPNGNREEQGNTQNPSGQRNPATSSGNGEILSNQGNPRVSGGLGESGIRVIPLRTMVGAVPGSFGQLSADSSGNSMGGLYYPAHGRFQQAENGNASSERGSQPSDEQQSSESQQRPMGGDLTRDGSSQRQHEATANARSISINILSAGGHQNTPESDRQIPGSVMRLLQNLFPGGEIHVEDGSLDVPSVPDQTRTSNGGGQEAELSASEDGIFLSNILRQIMPLIPGGQAGFGSGAESANASENGTAQDSANRVEDFNAGTSRRPDDSDSGSPSSKRQKTD